jgi:hypothetical protein
MRKKRFTGKTGLIHDELVNPSNPGLPDWANLCLFGDCLLRDVFFENYINGIPHFVILFPWKKRCMYECINLDKNELGLGDLNKPIRSLWSSPFGYTDKNRRIYLSHSKF